MDEGRSFRSGNFIPKPVFGFDFSTLMLFRCTKREYAEQLCQGQIFFGAPQNWIEEEKRGNKGQGDLLEGVFLSTESNNDSSFIRDLKANSALEHFNHEGFTFFRRKSVLSLRCLCLYGLRDNAFQKEICPDGHAQYEAIIPKSYYSCFTDYKTREEYDRADLKEQPVVVFIRDQNAFFGRIQTFLRTLGVKEEEIIISPVEYLDKYSSMIVSVTPPKELLLKDKAFEAQSEVRVIINSSSPSYLAYMREHNNTIAVSSMEDITDIKDYYFDDMTVQRWGNNGLLYSLPVSKEFQIEEMDFFELEDLLLNILGGTVKLQGLPEEWDTWDKKLQYLSDVIFKKYGVLVHVDEEKNVFFSNMTPDLKERQKERHKPDIEKDRYSKRIEGLINDKRLDEARTECLSACTNKLLFGIANYYLGKICSVQNKNQEAISYFQLAYKSDYKRIESLSEIASIYFRQGDYLAAIEMYNVVQDEKGYDCRIWCNIGICYIRLKQYDKAIEFFDKGIGIDEKDSFPYYNKGVALFLSNQHEEARSCMEKAIELDPNNDFYKQEYQKCFVS